MRRVIQEENMPQLGRIRLGRDGRTLKRGTLRAGSGSAGKSWPVRRAELLSQSGLEVREAPSPPPERQINRLFRISPKTD